MTTSLHKLRCGARSAAFATAALSLIAVTSGGPDAIAAGGDATTSDTTFRVAYGSIAVGQIETSLRVEGARYEVEGSFASGGVAKLFGKTTATASGQGRVGKRSMVPGRFAFGYASGDKRRDRRLMFRDGRATDVTIDPPYRKRSAEDWALPTVADLERVHDPVAGLLLRGETAEEVCNRTVRLYDGTVRLDIVMRSGRTKPFRARGYRGEATVCKLRLKPVAGFRKDGKKAAEIGAIEGAEAAFVRIPGTALHQVVELEVPTRIGKVSAKATELRFGEGLL